MVKVKDYVTKVAKRAWRVISRNHPSHSQGVSLCDVTIEKQFADNGLIESGVGRSPILERPGPDGVLIDVQGLYAITVDCCTESATADGNSFFRGRPAPRLFKSHGAASIRNRKDRPSIH